MLSPCHWRTPPKSYGPWEQVASDITEELVRRGHEVTLYATADSITSATLRSVAPVGLLEPEGKDLDDKLYGYLHSAMAFEEAKDFDILHNHYDGYPLVMSKMTPTPVVSTVHGFSSPYIHKLYLKYPNVNYVSISHADRKHCPDMNWVANIYHGIQLDDWPASTESEDWLGFIGRVHPFKGTHLAIQAAKKAGKVLKIAGSIDANDPVVNKYWEEEVEPHIDGEQIVYLGEIGGQARVDFYRKAQAILVPIQWEEPFGLVLIESMAAGTPLIAFNRGSVPEVVQDGVGGFVTKADDVDEMVQAIGRIHTIDRAAVRAYAEANFSVTKMVDQYEELYRKVIAKNR